MHQTYPPFHLVAFGLARFEQGLESGLHVQYCLGDFMQDVPEEEFLHLRRQTVLPTGIDEITDASQTAWLHVETPLFRSIEAVDVFWDVVVVEFTQHEHLTTPAREVMLHAIWPRQQPFANSELPVDLVLDQINAAIEATVGVDDGLDDSPVVIDVLGVRERAASGSYVAMVPVVFLSFAGHLGLLCPTTLPLGWFRAWPLL